MRNIAQIQRWLKKEQLDGLIIPSTDEFISEFAPPCNRRLLWATGFRGSTGSAIVVADDAALFLDGRYHLQGIEDTNGDIAVFPPSIAAKRAWLAEHLPSGGCLGIDPKIHGSADMEQWQQLTAEVGVSLRMLPQHPVDLLWGRNRPAPPSILIEDFPVEASGVTSARKCQELVEHVRTSGAAALLIADPEDVSWVLNIRAGGEIAHTDPGNWHVVPSVPSRLLVEADGAVTWFVDADAANSDVAASPGLQRLPLEELGTRVEALAETGVIAGDPRRTPAAVAMLLAARGGMKPDDSVARRRWRKHQNEVEAARNAHKIDGAVVIKFMAWLTRTISKRRVSEFEAAEVLENLRRAQPAYAGASMPLMSASGASGAQPHYIPRKNACRYLNDHPIYWMDSGGHYDGGTTDNTITMALQAPEPKHILAHTLVLQGFITLATAMFPEGTKGFQLDPLARQALWREGMDYPHNTGHGVGNALNIHEGPQIGREPGPTSTVPLEPKMIVSNEPGFYVPNDFGVRIESHMVVVPARPGYLGFETISHLPIDPNLVDFSRLTAAELAWLKAYHERIVEGVASYLDADTRSWLGEWSEIYADTQAQ